MNIDKKCSLFEVVNKDSYIFIFEIIIYFINFVNKWGSFCEFKGTVICMYFS